MLIAALAALLPALIAIDAPQALATVGSDGRSGDHGADRYEIVGTPDGCGGGVPGSTG